MESKDKLPANSLSTVKLVDIGLKNLLNLSDFSDTSIKLNNK